MATVLIMTEDDLVQMIKNYHAIVRLTDKGADVLSGPVNFTVSRPNGTGSGHGCPMEYMAGALGS